MSSDTHGLFWQRQRVVTGRFWELTSVWDPQTDDREHTGKTMSLLKACFQWTEQPPPTRPHLSSLSNSLLTGDEVSIQT